MEMWNHNSSDIIADDLLDSVERQFIGSTPQDALKDILELFTENYIEQLNSTRRATPRSI